MGLKWSLLRKSLVMFALAAVSVLSSNAATVPDLYTVAVVPDPAARDQRAAAIKAAMAQLLVRVTGSLNAPLDPAAQRLLAAPDEFLSSYGLDRQGRAVVGFQRGPVERVLDGLGLPVWGPERPLTLLWVAVDDGVGGRALLGGAVVFTSIVSGLSYVLRWSARAWRAGHELG